MDKRFLKFNMGNNLAVCCALEAETGTDKSAQVLKNSLSPCCLQESNSQPLTLPCSMLANQPETPVKCTSMLCSQILHHVDGTSHVVKIAAEADVDINLVKACLQNLL